MNDLLFWLPAIMGVIALAILQVILSNLKNPWPGRIVPIMFTVGSVVFILSYLILYSVDQSLRISIFTVCLCVPTLIFWLIYMICRHRQKQHE